MTEPLDGEGGVSVEEFVGQAFGDFSPSSEPPTAASSMTEPPPATPVADAAPPAVSTADGDAPVPPVAADAAPPVAPAEAAPSTPPDDPLASATPFTYQVDGQTKTYEGIKVLGDDGAIIDPGAMAGLANIISQHEHLQTDRRQLYQQVQQYEAVGGMARFQQVNEERAVLDAVSQVLVPLFVGAKGEAPDVNQVLRLLIQNEDGTIGWNEGLRSALSERIVNRVDRAKLDAGRAFQTTQTQAVTKHTQAADKERLGQEAVTEGMKTLRNHSDLKGWDENDFKAAEKHITNRKSFYVREASPEDVKQYPHLQVGQTFIDLPRLQDWVEERQGFKASAKQTTTTVTKAAQENAARLLTANRGKPTTTPPKPVEQKPVSRAQDAADAWDLMEGLAARSIRATP